MNTITEILEQENLIAFLIEVNDEDRILEKGLTEQKIDQKIDQMHNGDQRIGIIQEYSEEQKKEIQKHAELESEVRKSFRKTFLVMKKISKCAFPIPDYRIPSLLLPSLKEAVNKGWVTTISMSTSQRPLVCYTLTPQGQLVLNQYNQNK